MVTLLTRFRFFMWSFGRFKVPLIGYLKPHLMSLTNNEIVIKLRLNRRSKNHLHSMYFGALAVGADLAGGLHAFYHAEQEKVRLSLAFKSFQAQFLRRPESDVYFVCTMGERVKEMIIDSQKNAQRVNKLLEVTAYTNYQHQPEVVAHFTLELSLKVIS